METPALYRLEDCSYEHDHNYLETEEPRPIEPSAIRIRAGMLTPAFLDAIRHSDNEERRNLVLADDTLAGEPWHDRLGEVQGIHLVATHRRRTHQVLAVQRSAGGIPGSQCPKTATSSAPTGSSTG